MSVLPLLAAALLALPAADSELRSAGLLRQRGEAASHGSPADVGKARLLAHFDRVLERLEAQQAASLALARSRLDGGGEELAARRRVQVERLRAYRDAGRFPLNHEHPGQTLPIFVDARDTACAVGWLMRQDGWEDVVAAIVAADNNVYVGDVREGPLLDWVATSGLTREEAAMIQPGYEPPALQATFDDLLNGATLTSSGLLYENFELERTTSSVPLGVCAIAPDFPGCNLPIDPGLVAPLDEIGIAAGAELIHSRSEDVPFSAESVLSNWLFLGDDQPGDLGAFEGPFLSQIFISFDVVAVESSQGIASAALDSSAFWNVNQAVPLVSFELLAETSLVIQSAFAKGGGSGGTVLGTAVVGDEADEFGDFNPSLIDGRETVTFDPTRRLHVSTNVWLLPDSRVSGFFFEFDLVAIPEPGTGSLLALGLVGLALRRRPGQGASPT